MTSNKTSFSPLGNGNITVGKTLFNGITSTPLSSPRRASSSSLFSPSRLTSLRTPPRYSLSETSKRTETMSRNTSSPLLKSSKYNTNLAAYTDGKSPGLHSRIVQYSNEARDNLPVTHQTKYGSPGLFPIVHFFKKEIPIISPKPNRVMVRLASPDVHWYNTSTYNRSLSDTTDVRNGHHNQQISTETETRSVLDALREISRKRIHADTEFENSPDSNSCKRHKRTDSDVGTYESNKRAREDSPKSDTSSPSPSTTRQSKKICVVDVLAASFTSSQLLKEKMLNAAKRKSDVEIEQPVQSAAKRQTTLSNAETQTINFEANVEQVIAKQSLPEITVTGDKKSEKMNEAGDGNKEIQEETTSRQSIIFDDQKLEVQRKNKLAMLLGAISGEKPNLMPYSIDACEEKSDQNNATKLVGILSPMNKVKHDKHVHFNLTPEVKSIDNSSSVSTETTVEKPVEQNKESKSDAVNCSPTKQTSFATLSTTTTTTSTLSSPIVTTMITTTTTKTKEPTEVNPITNLQFSFGKPPVVNNFETPKKAPGGFKFNLSPTNASGEVVPKSTPTFNFSNSPKLSTITSSTNNSLTTTPKTSLPNFAMGSSNFEGDKSIIGLDKNSKINTAPGLSAMLPISKDSATTAISTSSTTGFGVASTASIGGSAQPTFTFGGNTGFGNPTTTASQFGMNSTLTFGVTPTSNSMFGTTTSPSAFGTTGNLSSNAPSTTGFGVVGGTTAFGGSATGGFGLTTSASGTPGLAATTSTIPAPNTTPSSIFGTTQTASFGTHTLTPAFGTPTPTSMFGTHIPNKSTLTFAKETPAGFGTVTTPSGYGAVTTSSGFGTMTTSSGFSVTPSSGFGVTTSSAFGTTNPPTFAKSTTIPTFGTTTSAFEALAAPKPAFNFAAFGAPTTSPPAFGASVTTTPAFGASVTSTPAFGTSAISSPAFGATAPSVHGFGAPVTSTPAFGVPVTSAPTFGAPTTSPPAFGGFGAATTNVPTGFGGNGFGAPTTSTSTFGNTGFTTGFGVNNFGATTTAPSGFGAGFGNNNAFGTKPQTTAPSMFGATTTANSTFGNQSVNNSFFGKTTTAGFTAPTTAPSAFTSNNKPFSFGGGTANNATFSFGNPNPSSSFTDNKTSGFGTGFPANSFNANTSTTTSTTTNSTTSIFGSASGFGNSSGFGTSSFGGNNPTQNFGANNNNTFGSSNNNFGTPTNNNNAFGGPSTNTPNFGFGNGDAASTFAKPQPPTGFGAGSGDSAFQFGGGSSANNVSAPVFGAPNPANNAAVGTGQVFSFGGSNPATPSATGVFAFGTPERKPAFPSNNSALGFGAGNSTGGNFGTPQFGTPTAGMFSIGSGTSTGQRQRHQLKAKRRT